MSLKDFSKVFAYRGKQGVAKESSTGGSFSPSKSASTTFANDTPGFGG
jgi:hypothetical protein